MFLRLTSAIRLRDGELFLMQNKKFSKKSLPRSIVSAVISSWNVFILLNPYSRADGSIEFFKLPLLRGAET